MQHQCQGTLSHLLKTTSLLGLLTLGLHVSLLVISSKPGLTQVLEGGLETTIVTISGSWRNSVTGGCSIIEQEGSAITIRNFTTSGVEFSQGIGTIEGRVLQTTHQSSLGTGERVTTLLNLSPDGQLMSGFWENQLGQRGPLELRAFRSFEERAACLSGDRLQQL